jgi:hypothetical protein
VDQLLIKGEILLKYIPVLRYRESEKKTLEDVTISDKILPLVEIVQEKRKVNMKSTCFEEIKELTNSKNKKLLIDFPLYIKLKPKTLVGVRNFIGPLIADPKRRIAEFKKLVGANIIPVASYNPNTPLFFNGNVSNEIQELRRSFNQIAFRIFPAHAQQALQEADALLKANDIILVDIDDNHYSDPILNNFFAYVNSYAKKHGCKTALIRSAIGPDITNTGLTNNSIVKELDNSLLKEYSKYGFDAFGDFCGIKKDQLTDGGMPSPGCIYYHWWTNAYYGHKGVYKEPTTFTTMVVKSLVSSQEWNDFQTKIAAHRTSCPGCKGISKIAATGQGGDSAPKWKIMISSHYLHTMEEFL